jgi:regulator of replication initiation timing
LEELVELTHEEERTLLKERNAKAREAINTLIAENQRLKAENQRLKALLEQAGVAE